MAMSLFIRNEDMLWGRYWGSKEEIDCLHFELCYYSPINWALEHGIKQFDPGAGGLHKRRRGFLAKENASMHRWYNKEMDKIIGIYDADGNFVKENWKQKDELIDKLVSSPHWGEDLNPYTNNMHYNEETGQLDNKWSKKYAWHDAKGERDYGNDASFRLKHKTVRDKDIKRRVVDRKLFDSDRQVYRRKDPSTGEYKYYTQWSINNLGGKEREISEKRYWKIRKKMDKRQSRIRGSEFKKGDVSE